MDPRTIFFFGKPGSGKGDQAKLLATSTNWKILTAGEQFRELSAQPTPVGSRIKEVNDAGLLQPHWLAEYLFLKSLFSLNSSESVIFDGFGRRLPEAELISDSLAWMQRSFSVVHLIVSDEELKHRIELRKKVQDRADDTVVDERLREYREHTEPIIDYFRNKGVLIDIDGERTREAIAEDVRKVLGL